MIAVHRGLGMLVIIFGIFWALVINVLTIKLFGDSYYSEHSWPKTSVLALAGLSCLVVGLWVRKKRAQFAQQEQAYIDSLSPKLDGIKKIAFAGPKDHIMFIPLHYWGIIYLLAALAYAIKAAWTR